MVLTESLPSTLICAFLYYTLVCVVHCSLNVFCIGQSDDNKVVFNGLEWALTLFLFWYPDFLRSDSKRQGSLRHIHWYCFLILTVSYITPQCITALKFSTLILIASSGILCSVLQKEKNKQTKSDLTSSEVTANLLFIFVRVYVLSNRTRWDNFQGEFL